MSIEDTYQKKTQLEHVLLRPDTYIGSVEFCDKTPMWVYDAKEEKILQREITFVPGLYKIFDEILVNAADNKQRDPKMNLIKITIDKFVSAFIIYFVITSSGTRMKYLCIITVEESQLHFTKLRRCTSLNLSSVLS